MTDIKTFAEEKYEESLVAIVKYGRDIAALAEEMMRMSEERAQFAQHNMPYAINSATKSFIEATAEDLAESTILMRSYIGKEQMFGVDR